MRSQGVVGQRHGCGRNVPEIPRRQDSISGAHENARIDRAEKTAHEADTDTNAHPATTLQRSERYGRARYGRHEVARMTAIGAGGRDRDKIWRGCKIGFGMHFLGDRAWVMLERAVG